MATDLIGRSQSNLYYIGLIEKVEEIISQIEVQPSSTFNCNLCMLRLIEHHWVTEKASDDEEAVETGNN